MKKLNLKNLNLGASDLLQRDQLKSIIGGGGYGCVGPLICLGLGCICGSGNGQLQHKCCDGLVCRKADNDPSLGVCLIA